jgi:hypothetical protein
MKELFCASESSNKPETSEKTDPKIAKPKRTGLQDIISFPSHPGLIEDHKNITGSRKQEVTTVATQWIKKRKTRKDRHVIYNIYRWLLPR